MSLETGVLFVQIIMLLVFMYVGIFKRVKIFNFFSIGILLSTIPIIKDYTGFMVVGILLIIYLLIDVIAGGAND